MPFSVHIAGLIGHPVGHSFSPGMQQAAFDALGILARYELWDTTVDRLAERVAALREPEMLGANVTIPHKTAVTEYLDAVAPEAARCGGAVNTIVREKWPSGVRLVGHNTDVEGLGRALDEHDAWSGGRRVLILGAGGAALAANAVAARRGAMVYIGARRIEAARAVLGAGDVEHALDLADHAAVAAALAHTDLLINATSVGMRDPATSPLPPDLLRHLPASSFVFDMVYNPPDTALLRAARAAGVRVAGGLEMLLFQGAASFSLWTRCPAPLDVMRAALGLGPGPASA
jgi:shikimate dehydrogenase